MPSIEVKATPLEIASTNEFKIGTQVSTWGYPGGYFGLFPMLSVGYLAGIDAFQAKSGKIIKQWVVNAAFNGGNSGGPLIHIESGMCRASSRRSRKKPRRFLKLSKKTPAPGSCIQAQQRTGNPLDGQRDS